MKDLRINNFQWGIGLLCAFMGALMLIASHHFTLFAATFLNNTIALMGFLLLICGTLVASIPVLRPSNLTILLTHLFTAALLIIYSLAYYQAGFLISPTVYGLLGLSVIASLFFSQTFRPFQNIELGEYPRSGEFLFFILGIVAFVSGILIFVATPGPHSFIGLILPPIFYQIIGSLLLIVGPLLVIFQLSTIRMRPAIQSKNPLFTWLVYLFAGIVFLLATTIPSQTGVLPIFFIGAGVALLITPWATPHLSKNLSQSLEARLSLTLGLVVALPLILTVSWTTKQQERFVLEKALENQRIQASALSESISEYVILHRSALKALSIHPDLTVQPQEYRQQELATFLSAYPNVAAFSMFDENGLPLASTNPRVMDIPATGYPAFEIARQTLRSSMDILISPVFQYPVLAFGEPIVTSDGRFSGVVMLSLPSDQITGFIVENNHSDSRTYLVDGLGRAIAHTDPQHITTFQDLSALPPVNAFRSSSNGHGTLRYDSPTGFMLAGYAHIPGLDWVIVVEQPESVALAGVISGRDVAFALLLLFLLATTLLGILFAKRLTAPLQSLSRAATELANGNILVPMPTSTFIEVERLARSFDEMRNRLAQRTVERENALQALQTANETLEKRVAERTEEISQQRALLQAVIEADPGGIAFIVQRNGEARFELHNPAYQLLTPHPEIPINGRTFDEVWPPQEDFRGTELLRPALQDHQCVDLEKIERRYPDGSIRYFTFHARPLDWQSLPAALIVVWEITPLVEAQQQAKESAESLRNYTQELERVNRDLQDFAFIASHDLIEPLRKVQAFGERLKNRYSAELSEEGQDWISRMQNASTRMQSMLNDLLSYSRISTRSEPFSQVDLNEIALQVLSDLEVRIERTGGIVELENLPVIQADPLQMRQLFQNLIGNALKFHKHDVPPRIYVRAKTIDEETIEIQVQDYGIGFDPLHLDRIFQPFQRLHGRSEYEGNGMGLAICRKIVERHKGHITAHSTIGTGTTFLITMPKYQPEAALEEIH